MIAAGGTGGHLFPAVAVAEQLSLLTNDMCEFHFVGTEGKIESRVVPQLGYSLHKIKLGGLTKSIKALLLPTQIIGAVAKCRSIISQNDIKAVVAAGAYLSYPPGVAAAMEKVPLVLMESNVNPGKSIRMLANRASRIITAFEESRGYFSDKLQSKLRPFGNPVRGSILNIPAKQAAKSSLNIPLDKKAIFIFGGSLGARSINNAVASNIDFLANSGHYIFWQTGRNFLYDKELPSNIRSMQFIDDMATYYAASELIIARSGATTVAEICIAGKPSLLVPLPSASNNEQLHNAKVLENKNAAITVLDNEIGNALPKLISELIADESRLEQMGDAAKSLAKPNAAKQTAIEILELINF